MVKKVVKKHVWTVQESFASAKTLRGRLPDLQMDTCEICQHWCVRGADGPVHPLCLEARRLESAPKQQRAFEV